MLANVLIMMLGALASILANKGIAVFNDGLRPIMPEHLEGRMDRKSLAATSLALGFGLVVGFGIPFSLTTPILLVHCILLGTDIIGCSSPDGKKGIVIAGIVGALYGLGLMLGLQFVVDLFAMLPINFLPSLGKVGAPIVVAFAAFPALVVAYQYGFKNGLIAFILTFLSRQFFQYHGTFVLAEGKNITLNPDGMALLIGMIVMIFFAIREKAPEGSTGANTALLGIFSKRVARVKKNMPLLAIMGGLISATTSAGIMAGDPISLNLLAQGKYSEAGLAALARGIGFVPLVATTAITTGVYGPAGMTLVFVVGIFIKNPLIAFVVGAIVIGIEIMLLEVIAKGLDRFPGMKNCGDHIRTAMTKILEIALLVGGMVAANDIAPGLGYLFVAGAYVLNKTSKKPLVDMAVGPVAAISLGIIVNILSLVGLYTG
jgi:hypothetical protein